MSPGIRQQWCHPGLTGEMGRARHSSHNSHNSRHPAAILDKKVAKGFHDVPRDGALGHRQATIFCIVSTPKSWG